MSKGWLLGCVPILVVAAWLRLPHLAYPPHSDIEYYTAWTYRMTRHGLGSAYGKGGIYEQLDGITHRLPPCNNGVFHCVLFYAMGEWLYPAVVGKPLSLETVVNILGNPPSHEQRVAQVVYRLPAIFGDLFTVVVLGLWVCVRAGPFHGWCVAMVIALHPALLYESVVWGQIDVWHSLFMAVSVMCLVLNRYYLASASFAAAMLCKIQPILLFPVLACTVLYAPAWQAHGDRLPFVAGTWRELRLLSTQWRRSAYCLLIFLAILGVCWAPWLFTGAGIHILDPYVRTVGQYRYTTLDAFNLYWLLEDWDLEKPIDYTQSRDDRSPIFQFGRWGISYRLFGLAAVGLCSLVSCVTLVRNRFSSKAIGTTALFQTLAMFLFATEMHERYLYPAIALAVVNYQPRLSWWLTWGVIGFAVTVNLGCVFPATAGSMLEWIVVPFRQDIVLTGNLVATTLLLFFAYLCGSMAICGNQKLTQSDRS